MAEQTDGGQGMGGDQPPGDETLGNVESQTLEMQAGADAEVELLSREEMMEAEPCDVIEIDDADDAALDEASFEVAEDPEGGKIVEGGMPDESPLADADPQATSGGYNYPPPFTRYEVFTPYTQYPYRTIGKLFFRRGGRSYVCSAASIGNNAIYTAGHCLHAGNNSSSGWATNVVFVPGYRDGNAPYGQWQARQLFVRTAWYRHGISKGLAQDMGGAILYPKSGRKISQRVGWLGFAWNWSRYQHWAQHGYPAASPFNGRRLIANYSSYAYQGSVGANPRPTGVGSDLTGGSSGGPWILRFGTANYVNGVNSYRRRSRPQEMFSPYFDNNAKSLFDTIRTR